MFSEVDAWKYNVRREAGGATYDLFTRVHTTLAVFRFFCSHKFKFPLRDVVDLKSRGDVS